MSQKRIILKGIGASPGTAKGTAKIIKSRKDFSGFKEGEILVAKITDPSFVMVMAKSRAIITDTGGIMSHPAIVARELGIPCVVATKKATTVLKNGQEVKVAGARGIIYEVE